jgi:hypothetical protein
MVEPICSSDLVNFHRATWRYYIPEDKTPKVQVVTLLLPLLLLLLLLLLLPLPPPPTTIFPASLGPTSPAATAATATDTTATTSWIRVLEKLIITQLLKKLTFYGTVEKTCG